MVFGYYILGQWLDETTGDTAKRESILSSESCVLLRDPRGCLVDVSPDIGEGAETLAYKVFLPDPDISAMEWHAISTAVEVMLEHRLFSGSSFDAEGSLMDPYTLCSVNALAFPTCCISSTSPSSRRLCRKEMQRMRDNARQGEFHLSRRAALHIRKWATPNGAIAFADEDVSALRRCGGCLTCCAKEELSLCGRCGQEMYCSRVCQVADWKRHKKACLAAERARVRKEKEPEEERIRAECAAKAAAREAAEAVAAREKVVNVLRSRSSTDPPLSKAGPSHTRPRQSRRTGRSEEEERCHNVHVSPQQKEARSNAFDQKQRLAHEEAVLRKKLAKVLAEKKEEERKGKEQALAEQAQPSTPTLEQHLVVS